MLSRMGPSRRSRRLDADELFARETLEVARAILGCTLVHRDCSGVVVEVEAYKGDAASHFVTRRIKGAMMGSTHGQLYIYPIYGMHWCLNVTTDAHGPGALLLRALEPRDGVELMRQRRGVERLEDLCSGPAKLVQALAVDPSLNGRRFDSEFELLARESEPPIAQGPRIGILTAMDLPWRFTVQGSRFLSRRG
jgi:DNA-3-methyladenine glycosylase